MSIRGGRVPYLTTGPEWRNGRRDGLKIHCPLKTCRFDPGLGHTRSLKLVLEASLVLGEISAGRVETRHRFAPTIPPVRFSPVFATFGGLLVAAIWT